MRLCVYQCGRLAYGDLTHDFRVAFAGRNYQVGRRGAIGHEVARGVSAFRQHHPDLGPIRRGFAVGGVMNLEYDIRSLGDDLRGIAELKALSAYAGVELA